MRAISNFAERIGRAARRGGRSVPVAFRGTRPMGFIDPIASGVLRGWAVDPQAPSRSLEIELVVGDHVLARTRADHPRADVAERLGVGAGHGFQIALETLPHPLVAGESISLRDPVGGRPLRAPAYRVTRADERAIAAAVAGCRYPPGHFYSPTADLSEVRRDHDRIFSVPDEIPGIDLNVAAQKKLLERLAPLVRDLPFGANADASAEAGFRYYFDNPAFSWFDGLVLHGMLRHFEPRRLIEIGSGFSSCMTLDTNERWLDGRIECSFIEPFPKLLRSLLGDAANETSITEARLQDVPTERFEALRAGDVLFVDSTHVSKVDSDVNHLFFRVLPKLAPGVLVHLHDIFHPFEYPPEWIYEGRSWNENYLLRAFLQDNDRYEVVLFNHYLALCQRDFVQAQMPIALRNPGGSIWLRKLGR